MAELKPCPFCGSEAQIVSWTNQFSWKANYGVKCGSCKILFDSSHGYFHTEEEATIAWNRRDGD